MPKFYARLVLTMSIVLLVFVIILMVSLSQHQSSEYSDAHHPPFRLSQPPTTIRDTGSSRRMPDTMKDLPNFNNRELHNFTLLTDDPKTVQVWGWYETRQAKEQCAEIDYSESLGHVPILSVILCFHSKENVSNLLHTVHAVVQRTPPYLLKEVILVDDNSMNDDFGQILELYTNVVFQHKVRIYRSPERLGLIRARLKGIQMAEGEVVAVMDSHVEVQPGWAEPLLYEIKINPKTMAASYIDWMERKGDTWEYRHGGTTWRTYFEWTFVFGWQQMSQQDIKDRKSLIEPIKTPVIIGTIFAIRRDFFLKIGAFDDGMQLWGGENLDLPVRVWMCGGRVLNVPCSRAGHLEAQGGRDYRASQEWANSKNANYKRFAEVWAGEYKKYFYMYTPDAEKADAGDLSERMKLRSVCPGNFSWLLKEVFPQIGMPDKNTFAWGPLTNKGSQNCLDTRYSLLPGLEMCEHDFSRQGVFWSEDLTLRFPMHILNCKHLAQVGVTERGLYMDEFTSYHNTSMGTKWIHWQDGPIIDTTEDLCMDGSDRQNIKFTECDKESPYQKWSFKEYTPAYHKLLSGTYPDQTTQEIMNHFKQKASGVEGLAAVRVQTINKTPRLLKKLAKHQFPDR